MAAYDHERCVLGGCQYPDQRPDTYCIRCGVTRDGSRMQHSGRLSIKKSHRAEGRNFID